MSRIFWRESVSTFVGQVWPWVLLEVAAKVSAGNVVIWRPDGTREPGSKFTLMAVSWRVLAANHRGLSIWPLTTWQLLPQSRSSERKEEGKAEVTVSFRWPSFRSDIRSLLLCSIGHTDWSPYTAWVCGGRGYAKIWTQEWGATESFHRLPSQVWPAQDPRWTVKMLPSLWEGKGRQT